MAGARGCRPSRLRPIGPLKRDPILNRRVAIVGAGVTGLVAARELLRAGGFAVELFERWPDVGGQASAFDVGGGVRIERYYHHLFPSDRDMIELHEELLPGDLEWHRSAVAIWRGGRQWPFGGPLDLLRYGPLSPSERMRLGLAVLRLQRRRDWQAMDDVPALTWLRSACGDAGVDRVWQPLLLGKFGADADDVPLAWLWSKLVLRRRLAGKDLGGERLGYPRSSFQAICDALRRDCVERGAVLHLDRQVQRVDREGDEYVLRCGPPGAYRAVFDPAGVVVGPNSTADVVLFSTPTDVTLQVAEWPPAFEAALAEWRYRSAVVLLLELARPFTQAYWTNVADRDVPFLGLVEHTNLVPAERYPARYLYVSHYVAAEDELLRIGTDELLRRSLPALMRMSPGFGEGGVLRRWSFREPAAQPIPRVGNRRRILPFASPRPGLFIANTTQIYPEDRGTNYSVRLGRDVAAAIRSTAA
jgi:protoporphyrinogen oxidase